MSGRAGHPLDADEIAMLRVMFQDHGEREVIRAAGTSSTTVFRALAGLPLYPGSRLMIRKLILRGDS